MNGLVTDCADPGGTDHFPGERHGRLDRSRSTLCLGAPGHGLHAPEAVRRAGAGVFLALSLASVGRPAGAAVLLCGGPRQAPALRLDRMVRRHRRRRCLYRRLAAAFSLSREPRPRPLGLVLSASSCILSHYISAYGSNSSFTV